jgi:hypothetical protein
MSKPDYLQPPEMSPLSASAVPDKAFRCSVEGGCSERLYWNPQRGKLECWNPDCELYKGNSQTPNEEDE